LATSVKALREESELYDVTLACDDDQIEAHKVILSASSSFFKRIIKRNPHAHPLLYLKGVKVDILTSMLDFMYLGRTSVAQSQVETFLMLGDELGVKGLVRNKEKEQEEHVEEPQAVEIGFVVKEEGQSGLFDDPRIPIDTLDHIEMKSVETEMPLNSAFDKIENHLQESFGESDFHLNETFDKYEGSCTMNDTFDNTGMVLNKTFENEKIVNDLNRTQSSDSDADVQANSLMDKTVDADNRPVWQCTECNKISKSKANLKKHVEIHMTGLSFSCNYCDKVCKTSNSLNVHIYTSKPCKNKKFSKV